MIAVVTGAAGFIGRNPVGVLLAGGDVVFDGAGQPGGSSHWAGRFPVCLWHKVDVTQRPDTN